MIISDNFYRCVAMCSEKRSVMSDRRFIALIILQKKNNLYLIYGFTCSKENLILNLLINKSFKCFKFVPKLKIILQESFSKNL